MGTEFDLKSNQTFCDLDNWTNLLFCRRRSFVNLMQLRVCLYIRSSRKLKLSKFAYHCLRIVINIRLHLLPTNLKPKWLNVKSSRLCAATNAPSPNIFIAKNFQCFIYRFIASIVHSHRRFLLQPQCDLINNMESKRQYKVSNPDCPEKMMPRLSLVRNFLRLFFLTRPNQRKL